MHKVSKTTSKQAKSPFSRNFQREQKRQAILSEAADLFNNQGTRATTLSDIATRLKLTKTTLYYYVKSKEELIYLCYLASCDKLVEMLDSAESHEGPGREKLAVFMRSNFQVWKAVRLGQQSHYAILTEIRALREDHRQEVAERYSLLFKRVKSMIQVGISDGSVVPCNEVDTALAIFGLVQLAVIWLPEIEADGFDQAANQFIDLIFNGIAKQDEFVPGSFPGIPDAPAGFDRQAQNLKKQEAFYKTGSAFFNRKGFKGTSLDEIAEALDVTKGAFYYHIRDKEELVFHCFQRSLSIVNSMQDLAEIDAKSGLNELQLCAHYLFHIQNSDAGPLIRFNLIPSLSRKNKQTVMKGLKDVSDRFGRMIDKGIADGSIRPVNPFITEQVLTAAVDISAELQWVRKFENLNDAYKSYFSFYFNGISSE